MILLLGCVRAPLPALPPTDSAGQLLASLPPGVAGEVSPLHNEMSGEVYGQRVPLSEAVVVAGVPCAGDLELYDDSWSCTLSAPLSLGALTVPAGAYLNPYYSGSLRILEAAWIGQERLEVGAALCLERAVLWPSGRLKRCDLAAALTVGGHTFAPETTLWLAEDGAPAEAMFYAPHTFGGQVYDPGHVEFTDGEVTTHSPDYFGD